MSMAITADETASEPASLNATGPFARVGVLL